MMRPSLPSSFFRLHIDKLGLDAEPVINREQETRRSASRSIKVSISCIEQVTDCVQTLRFYNVTQTMHRQCIAYTYIYFVLSVVLFLVFVCLSRLVTMFSWFKLSNQF